MITLKSNILFLLCYIENNYSYINYLINVTRCKTVKYTN